MLATTAFVLTSNTVAVAAEVVQADEVLIIVNWTTEDFFLPYRGLTMLQVHFRLAYPVIFELTWPECDTTAVI